MPRPWLGIRLAWRPVTASAGEERFAKIGYRRERLPWLKNKKHISALIRPKIHTLEFYDASDLFHTRKPFWTVDRQRFSLNALEEITQWPDSEALFFAFSGYDIAVEYRSIFDANEVIRRWLAYGVRGYWVIKRPGEGITLVRDLFDVRDGCRRAIEISSRGFSMYINDLSHGSELSDRNRILFIRTLQLNMQRLTGRFCIDDAISIRLATRCYRHMIYQMAVEYEPF